MRGKKSGVSEIPVLVLNSFFFGHQKSSISLCVRVVTGQIEPERKMYFRLEKLHKNRPANGNLMVSTEFS